MRGWYVLISHIPVQQLALLGYDLISENDEFTLYRDIYGEEQIVQKARPFLWVEDLNDAVALGAAAVIAAPTL